MENIEGYTLIKKVKLANAGKSGKSIVIPTIWREKNNLKDGDIVNLIWHPNNDALVIKIQDALQIKRYVFGNTKRRQSSVVHIPVDWVKTQNIPAGTDLLIYESHTTGELKIIRSTPRPPSPSISS